MTLYSATRIRRGLRDFLLGRLIAAALSFIANILIVRVLTEDAYAHYATLTGLQLILLLLVSFGIERTMARYAGEGAMNWTRWNLVRLVGGGIALRTISILMFALFLVPIPAIIVRLLNVPEWKEVALAFWTYTFFFGLFDVLQAVAQSFMLQEAIRLGLTLQWSLRVLAVGLYFIVAIPLGLNEVLWIFALTSIIPCLILIHPVFLTINGRPTQLPEDDRDRGFSDVLALGGHNYVEKLATLPTSGAFFRLMAANAMSSLATASFGFYQTLWGVFHRHMPTTLSMSMMEAIVSGRYTAKRDLDEVQTVLSVMFKINLMMITLLVAWLAVSGRDIVSLLTGGKYVDQAWAIALITSGLIPASYWQLLIIYSNTLSASYVLSKSALWSSLLVIPIVILLIHFPDRGLLILSFAVPLIGSSQIAIAHLYLNTLNIPLRFNFRGILVIVFSAIIAAAVTELTVTALLGSASNSRQLISTAISACSLTIAFAFTIYLLKAFSTPESIFLAKFHHRLATLLSWACKRESYS